MRYFRPKYVFRTCLLLLVFLTDLGSSKCFAISCPVVKQQAVIADMDIRHFNLFDLFQLDINQLFEVLVVVILLLVIFIFHTLWQHRQKRRLKALNIILSEQRAEQAIILEEKLVKEREMQHLNEVQGRILSIIGHDLRGPLASMYELFRIYARDSDSIEPGEMNQFIQECYQQLGSVYFLAENLLFWAKSQHEGMNAYPGDYSLLKMVGESVEVMEQIAKSKHIDLHVYIDEGISVYCDYNQISSVIRNLVSNSIKFTNHGGSMTIVSRTIKGEAVVTISDNGVGMEQSKLDMMIQQQVAYSTRGTDDEPGTGLGISLIAEFVNKNGGKLIGSSRPGCGTSFTFSLPLSRSENE